MRKLWLLPFLCALLPALATHIAWWISMEKGFIPICIPYFEGCTSISRAARHGIANDIFKIIMIPSAILQAFTWFNCKEWIKKTNPTIGNIISSLGVLASLSLSLYVVFLGTEGAIYQMMRRYGILVYFGSTYFAQLTLHSKMHLVAKGRLPQVMWGLCLILFPLCLLGLYLSITTQNMPINDPIENIIEWNLSLLMSLWFVLLAFLWKKH